MYKNRSQDFYVKEFEYGFHALVQPVLNLNKCVNPCVEERILDRDSDCMRTCCYMLKSIFEYDVLEFVLLQCSEHSDK